MTCADQISSKSIDLTRLQVASTKPKDAETSSENNVEYSSREVEPAALVLQDLLRAHAIFLLHHDSSLSALFVRCKRPKFTSIMGRYWDLFLSTWNVLLHGNPIRNVMGGIIVAASGELGFGVGEEDRGSGEREVLEGLVGRVEGLVDVVVSKFGSCDPDDAASTTAPWLGIGNEPDTDDGAIFLGVGALSRKSVRDITFWMEDLYTWGENAYGVLESPTATRQRTRPKRTPNSHTRRSSAAASRTSLNTSILGRDAEPNAKPPSAGIPRALTDPAERVNSQSPKTGTNGNVSPNTDESAGGMEKYMDYLKLGYGKYWTIGGESAASQPSGLESTAKEDDAKDIVRPVPERRISRSDDSAGYFLIGLMDDVEDDSVEDPVERRFADIAEQEPENSRTMLRTVTVELEKEGRDQPATEFTKILGSHDRELSISRSIRSRGNFDSQDSNKAKKMRVVVYVNKPFILTFIFALRTDSLAFNGLYRSLHHQLAPLRKTLSLSTTYRPDKPDAGSITGEIYNLIWDPKELTVHCTIPNIPDPVMVQKGDQTVWSRTDALNTHIQLLNIFTSSRLDVTELERTCKTSRGWWIVWSNIVERQSREARSDSDPQVNTEDDDSRRRGSDSSSDDHSTITQDYVTAKEIFLIRKASDHGGGHVRSASISSSGAGWPDGASKYIEGLLRHNR